MSTPLPSAPPELDAAVRRAAASATDRLDLWARLVPALGVEAMAEIGVFKGEFAAHLLAACAGIRRYHLIDPWRSLRDWNKPTNTDDDAFRAIRAEAMARTQFAEDRRHVLCGTTLEVIDELHPESLDLAYVDGDHTLRGITVDLIAVWPKIRPGGSLGGDDFVPSVWQHAGRYEPTLVFPFAVYFAEAVRARFYALPYYQFLMVKDGGGFEMVDLTGRYGDRTLRGQLRLVARARAAIVRMVGAAIAPVRTLTGR